MNFRVPTPKPMSFGIWLAIILVMGTTIGMFDYGYQNVQTRSSDDDDDDSGNSHTRSSRSDTAGNSLLCYGAGGLAVLGGVPLGDVVADGHAAHSAGICP
jgi:hypothetical protein